jgi:hypothetical protein
MSMQRTLVDGGIVCARHLEPTIKNSLSGTIVTNSDQGVFMRPSNRGRYYHDGRFPTLLSVINHYNSRFSLNLTGLEKSDLAEYLKSLPKRQ